MNNARRMLAAALFLSFAACSAFAAESDWPQWRYNDARDGKSPDEGLLEEWPADGPKLLWHFTGLGDGFSTVSVADGTIYATGAVNEKLTLFALTPDGKEKWKKVLGPAWTKNYPGARATPTIDKDKIYLLSGLGTIGCYETRDGSTVWERKMSEFGSRPPHWGYSEHILIARKIAVLTPGGKNCVVALDKTTGKTVWTSPGNGGAVHYGSCMLAFHEKVPMIVGSNRGGLFAVSPKDGSVFWTNDFASGNTANVPTPVYADGHVFWAVGYGKGGICLKIEKDGDGLKATEAWRTSDMVCHHGGYVIHEGHIYGNNGGGWACLDLKTGARKWRGRAVGKGSLCFADGMLYLFGERGGKAGLVAAAPDGFRESGSFAVKGSGTSWAHPVVIGGRLYLRYADNLYCFDVKK